MQLTSLYSVKLPRTAVLPADVYKALKPIFEQRVTLAFSKSQHFKYKLGTLVSALSWSSPLKAYNNTYINAAWDIVVLTVQAFGYTEDDIVERIDQVLHMVEKQCRPARH